MDSYEVLQRRHQIILFSDYQAKIMQFCGLLVYFIIMPHESVHKLFSLWYSLCNLLRKKGKYIPRTTWLTLKLSLLSPSSFTKDSAANFLKAIKGICLCWRILPAYWHVQHKLYLYSAAKSCLKQYSSLIRKLCQVLQFLSCHIWQSCIIFNISGENTLNRELHMKNRNRFISL